MATRTRTTRTPAPAPAAAPAPAPAAPRPPVHPEVIRESAVAWWCPVCDRSHTKREDRCDGCGYIR